MVRSKGMPSWQLFYGGMKRGVELSFLGFVDPFLESCRCAGLGTALSGCGSCFQFQKYCQLFIRAHVPARLLHDQTHRELVYRPLQFHECSPDVIGVHDETLSVAMRINNPDCPALRIND
jgi:hypothetical protein